jgi:hypothetical protein
MLTSKKSPGIRPHRRQFVIGTKPFLPYQNWCSHPLDSSLYLSYCPDLRAGFVRDADGVCWGLLGLAIETLEDKLEPLAEIARTPSTKVSELYHSWAGRWVLLGQGQVHMDASGLLGCFYSMTPDNQMWVSSSSALLASILSSESSPAVDSRSLGYETGISWFTPPRSRFIDIKRLLPSQVLDLKDNSVRPRPLMSPIDPSLGFDKTLELVKRSLVTTVQRLSQETKGSQLWLGLTAGFDSRTSMAIASYAGIDFLPFTRITQRMSVADRLLPPKLAQECGCKHVFMRNRKPKHNLERKQLVVEHTACQVSDGDAEPFITGVRDGMEGISFGGHGWAIASGFGDLRQLPESVENSQIGAEQIAQLFREPVNSTAVAGLRDWLEWTIKHPQEHLDWRDRFYLEQRQTGWLASKEHLYDLTQLERFPLLNAARNYSLLLGLKESQRLCSLVQKELIRQLAPELLKYPFNPPDSDFSIVRAIATTCRDYPLSGYQRVVKLGKTKIKRVLVDRLKK